MSVWISVSRPSWMMPVLSFWERCELEVNKDYGYVEVSVDGGSTWQGIYFANGYHETWREERVDLSAYATEPEVWIRFRLTTNASGQYDGWWIDDVAIDETATPDLPYPFVDDMEGPQTESNWLWSSWKLVETDYHSPIRSWHDSPDGWPAVQNPGSSLTLAGEIDLTGSECPQLTFWHRIDESTGYFYVQLSTNGGHDWTTAATFTSDVPWTQTQVDLSPYTDSLLRVRFRTYAYGTGNDGWYVDDVRIENAPTVDLEPLTGVTRHGADLVWNQNHDPNFDRYEVYRKQGSGVDNGDVLVAWTPDRDDTTHSDVFAAVDPYFYCYRVYKVDTLGVYSCPGVEECAVYDDVAVQAYPFEDDFESGPGDWDWGAPWALTDEDPHGGSSCWTDSGACRCRCRSPCPRARPRRCWRGYCARGWRVLCRQPTAGWRGW